MSRSSMNHIWQFSKCGTQPGVISSLSYCLTQCNNIMAIFITKFVVAPSFSLCFGTVHGHSKQDYEMWYKSHSCHTLVHRPDFHSRLIGVTVRYFPSSCQNKDLQMSVVIRLTNFAVRPITLSSMCPAILRLKIKSSQHVKRDRLVRNYFSWAGVVGH